MKNVFLIFLALILASPLLQAQEETLFGRQRSAGFFVSPIIEFSSLDNEVRTSSGGGLGLVVDNFFIGGYALAAIDIDALIEDEADALEVDIAHSGLWLGYTWPSYKLAHLFTSVKGGWGLVNTSFDEFGLDNADRVFVVTPEVGVEVNLFRWLRLAGTVGYRSVSGINPDNTSVTTADVSGVTGGLTLRIGGFGRQRNRNCDR